MIKKQYIIPILILFVQSFMSIAEAYDNNFVHQMINGKAAQQSVEFQRTIKNYGFKDIYDSVNKKEIWQWFYDGAKLEDETVCRSRNHFHDPLNPWDSAGLNNIAVNTFCFSIGEDFSVDSSIIWAQKSPGSLVTKNYWSWPKARNYYYKALTSSTKDEREQNFAFTFRALGQVMHLLSDSSVPAHVRNDIHVFPLTIPVIGIEVGKQTYESWARKKFSVLDYTAKKVDQSIFNQAVTNSSAPVPISALWDQNKYTGTNPSVTWTTNPFISAFGLAEYTNANFFSEDTIFNDYPHPKKENTTAKLVEQTAKDGKKDKVWYIQGYTSEKLAAYSYLNKWLLPDKWEYNLDGYVYEDYASQLIPRAVGYSAGLLNYFFRGDIEVIPDYGTGSGYVIVNNTDEDMSGTFELLYDNKNDERVKAWSSYLSIHKKSSGNNKSTNIIFTPPTNAKEDGKYMLVFRGKLGNEENAVVGRSLKFDFKDDEFLFFVSAAPYGLTENARIYITAILPFNMIPENSAYTLTPVDSFTLSGTRYFDGMYTTSLIVNNNSAKDTHTISHTIQDEKLGIRWSETLNNYGMIVNNTIPPKGFLIGKHKCYTNELSYPITPWAGSRRSTSVYPYIERVFDWASWKAGNTQPFKYYYGSKVLLADIGIEPSVESGLPGDLYIEKNSVIALLNTKALRILRSYDVNIEERSFSCNIQNRYPYETTYTWKRVVRHGKQHLYIGDTFIKSVDFYSVSMWKGPSFDNPWWGCYDMAYFISHMWDEYLIAHPGGHAVSGIVADKIIDIIDYDNYNDDNLFVLFYSIRDYRGFGYPIEYFLAYKTQDGSFTEVSLYKGIQYYDRLFGVSSQLNGDTIVYSYHLQHTATPRPADWQTEKFVTGIINITDSNLSNGYRQEFEYTPLEEDSYPAGLTLSSVSDGNLVPDTYTYLVSALNPINQTLASSASSITLTGDEGGVMLRWNAVAGATHYVVYGRKGDVTALAIAGSTTWTDTGAGGYTANIEHTNQFVDTVIDAPWHLPESPIKPFLSAIGIHKKAN